MFVEVCVLIHRLVVVDDHIEGVPIFRLHSDELFIRVLVIEQIPDNGVAVLCKARAGMMVISSALGVSVGEA